MPRTVPAMFFEPLIHGVDVMLRKFERLMGIDPLFDEKPRRDLRTRMVNRQKDLVNLPAVTEQVASHYQSDADERSVHLFVDVAPDALVIGASSDLHRMIEQLVISALQNTPDNGCVTISGRVSNGVVTFTFCSYSLVTLPGDPGQFTEGCYAIATELSSPGLSFCPSHVRKVLHAHGGRMEVSKEPGHRSRVVIRLPVA